MNIIKIVTAACVCMILTTATLSHDERWRGIVPIRSTCEDVKRILGVASCKFPSSTYYLEDVSIIIEFSDAKKNCQRSTEQKCQAGVQHALWNVPRGTVLSVAVALKKPLPLANFHVDGGDYERSVDERAQLVGDDIVSYNNYKEGIYITVIDGEVREVLYTPGAKNEHLRCPNAPKPPPQASSEEFLPSFFNGYGDIPFDEEKKLLDDFARVLQEYAPDSQGYIVVYAGQHASKGEAKARAERAKAYIVKTYGIGESRVGAVDGGCHEKMGVELHIGPHGLPPPMTFPSVRK